MRCVVCVLDVFKVEAKCHYYIYLWLVHFHLLDDDRCPGSRLGIAYAYAFPVYEGNACGHDDRAGICKIRKIGK